MILLPIENFTINTTLTKDEVITKLNEVVEQKKFRMPLFFDTSKKPYIGEIESDTFKIRRAISHSQRSSFLPVITGTLYSTPTTTEIRIKMRPFDAVMAFMVVWLSIPVFILVIPIASGNAGQESSNFFPPIYPAGFIVFGYALLIGSFKYESIKFKKFFKELFK